MTPCLHPTVVTLSDRHCIEVSETLVMPVQIHNHVFFNISFASQTQERQRRQLPGFSPVESEVFVETDMDISSKINAVFRKIAGRIEDNLRGVAPVFVETVTE